MTFHVFDPQDIEDILDRDLPAVWRAEDMKAAAEGRRRAAGKAALTRAGKGVSKRADARKGRNDAERPELQGWDTFDANGLLGGSTRAGLRIRRGTKGKADVTPMTPALCRQMTRCVGPPSP